MKNKSRTNTTLYTMLILMLLLLIHHQTFNQVKEIREQNWKNNLEIHRLQDDNIALKRRIGELQCE